MVIELESNRGKLELYRPHAHLYAQLLKRRPTRAADVVTKGVAIAKEVRYAAVWKDSFKLRALAEPLVRFDESIALH